MGAVPSPSLASARNQPKQLIKTPVFTGILLITATMGFAQGRITFQNDSLHLVYFTTDTWRLMPADVGLAGKATSPTFGQTLTAELWGGTSSSSLTLQATTGMSTTSGSDGIIATKSFIGSGTVAGVPNYFQVRVYGSGLGSGLPYYFGETSIFTTVPSTSAVAYNSIVNLGGQAQSTWAVGTYPLDSSVWGPGAKGAIQLGATWGPPTIRAIWVIPTGSVRVGDPPVWMGVTAWNTDYYQWRRNGTNIAGATSSTYTIGAQLTNAGTYNVAVSSVSYVAPVISSDIVLQVLPPPTNWWTLQGTNLVLGWTDPLVLQDATNVLGPFHDVPGATSPYRTNVLLHPLLFFRWRE